MADCRWKGWKRYETHYPYLDLGGQEVFHHVRLRNPKAFPYHVPGCKKGEGKPPEADGMLYRLPELLEGFRSSGRIFWTEGEKDADAVVAAGGVATTSHQGADHLTASQASWFRLYRRGVLYVLADKDAPGGYSAMQRVEKLKTAEVSCRVVVVKAAVGVDVYDHLAAGLSLEDLVPVDMEKLTLVAARHASTLQSVSSFRYSSGEK